MFIHHCRTETALNLGMFEQDLREREEGFTIMWTWFIHFFRHKSYFTSGFGVIWKMDYKLVVFLVFISLAIAKKEERGKIPCSNSPIG